MQETLVTAWRGLGGFEGRASVRTWMYRIATSRCLNILRAASRRPTTNLPLDFEPPDPSRLGEVTWLEPYPDLFLEELPDASAGPESRYEAREAMSLAFVTALQLLPPRQRAALILLPLEYQGRELAREFFATVAFRRGRRYRMVPTRANGQPAFAVYLRDPVNGVTRAWGLFVLTLAGDRVSAITRLDNASVPRFGLPRTLADGTGDRDQSPLLTIDSRTGTLVLCPQMGGSRFFRQWPASVMPADSQRAGNTAQRFSRNAETAVRTAIPRLEVSHDVHRQRQACRRRLLQAARPRHRQRAAGAGDGRRRA